MENKDKINFDLNFLDKNFKEKPQQKHSTSGGPNWGYPNDGHNVEDSKVTVSPGGLSDAAKKWAWGIGITLILIVVGSSSGGSNNSPSTPSVSNNTSQDTHSPDDYTFKTGSGQTFRCSSYSYGRAMSLRPDATTQSQINSDSAAIDTRTNNLALENTRIKNMYVDENDQYSIDTYNEAVSNYNFKSSSLKNVIANWNARNTAFNVKIDTYNNYLDANCTPQ